MQAPAAAADSPPHARRSAVPGIGILAGFLPWIVFGLLSWIGHRPEGVACALVTSAGQNAWRAHTRNLKSFELATLAFLVVEMSAWLSGHGAWFEPWGTVVLNLVLGFTAVGTIAAGRPFTWQYARDDWPEPYWRDPMFLRTNAILTWVWAAAFFFGAATALIAVDATRGVVVLRYVAPNLATAFAAVFSFVFPAWYPRREIRRKLQRLDPHRWPLPSPLDADSPVIVIGNGIAELATAALLARGGATVTVVGSPESPHIASSAVRPCDVVGSSGLGPGGAVTNLLRRLGADEALPWRRLRRAAIIDGARVSLPSGRDALAAALCAAFPSDADGIRTLLSLLESMRAEALIGADRNGGVAAPASTVDEELYWPANHPRLFPWQDRSFHDLLRAHVRDPRLIALLWCMGSRPWERADACTVGRLAPELEVWIDGPASIEGGTPALRALLTAAIERHGGSVLRGRVGERVVVEQGRVAAVETSDGERLRAGLVVSGAGARATFSSLIGAKPPMPVSDPAAGVLAMEFELDGIHELGSELVLIPEGPIGPHSILSHAPLRPALTLIAAHDCVQDAASRALLRCFPELAGRLTLRKAARLHADRSPLPAKSHVEGLFFVGRDIEPGSGLAAEVNGATLVADRILRGDAGP